jgi:hypothetical protein
MEKAIKSSFLMFAGYNTWANGRLYDRNLMFTVLREGRCRPECGWNSVWRDLR